MTESHNVIVTGNLTKVFRDFWGRPKVRAVDGVSFEVRRGEVLGVLGPNGSGKSTTIKMILGLLYPTAGTVRVLDRPPVDTQTKRQIGFLPEETSLYPYLTVRETLDFFGRLFRMPARVRAARIDLLLGMVDLRDAADRRIGELSKGMARRVGLAQALINDPEIVILDEPTSGLDPTGRRKVKDLILDLKGRGKTVLLSSHLLAEVEDVCDRILILFGGKILSQGNIRDLLRMETQVQITVPRQPEDRLRRTIEQVMREYAENEIAVEQPQISLERYFLDRIQSRLVADQPPAAGKN